MIFPMLYLSNNLKEKEKKNKYWLSHFAKSWQNRGMGWKRWDGKDRGYIQWVVGNFQNENSC